jgi:putative intracellular protease/amidase
MKVALLIPQRDFKDESVANAKEMLEKWHVDAVIASYYSGECVGYHGATYRPQLNAASLNPQDFDAIIIIDGLGVDTYKLYDFRPLLDTLRLFSSSKKIVAGISNGIKVIARANIIADTKVSIPNNEEVRRLVGLYKGVPSKNYLEFDKGVLTLSIPDPDKVSEFTGLLINKLGVK